MQVTFDHVRPEADNIKTFYFKTDAPLSYTAGQYIELMLDHSNPDDRGIRRWFTLSSSPEDALISITTKFSQKGSSFKKALLGLQPGAKLRISDPMGDFVLPKLIQTPLIFIAGGIGITPIHSILSWLAQTSEQRPIKLYYAVNTEDEIIFQDTFAKANQHATIIVSDPSPAWGGERGRLSAELILALEKPTSDSLIYISGPESMVEDLRSQFRAQGIGLSQLVGDFFSGYTTL